MEDGSDSGKVPLVKKGGQYREDFSARWPNYPRWVEIHVGIAGPDLHSMVVFE